MATLAATLVGSFALAGAVAQVGGESDATEVSADSFTSAEVCAECHQAIHAVWRQSMHSRAFSNPVFQAAYRTAKKVDSRNQAQLCLECHAPTTRKTADYRAQEPISREGVTCDFCHSVREVKVGGQNVTQVDVQIGRTKYGPLRHAQSPAHQVVHSPLHQRSEFCATCHEYRNQHGVAILETYSEWKASPYAEQGQQCQDCHMPLVPGRVVAQSIEGLPVREGINLHAISGSHDQEKVRDAVTMKLLSADRIGEDKVSVRISVANVGSGHAFPTGLPMHRALLEVDLTDRGRQVARRVVSFEKALMNRGRPITEEHEAFFEARSIRSDNRLKPKEERTISLTFSDVTAPEGQIEVGFWYQYATRAVRVRDGVEVIEPTEMKFLLASAKKPLPRLRGR